MKLKRLAITLAGGLVALVIGLAVLLAVLVSGMDLRARLTAAIEQATGRTVTIRGPVGFTLYPSAGFNAADVSIGNAKGGRAAQMLTANSVNIGVAVQPLLKREIEVTALNLGDPIVSLEILPDGAPNWVLKPRLASSGGGAFKPKVDTIRLRGVTIKNGAIGFFNAVTHSAYSLTQVDATIDLAGLDRPLSISGAGVYAGERAKLSATLSTPALLLAGKPMSLALDLDAAPLALRFDGVMLPGAGGLSGALIASGPDINRLAEWGGHPIAGASGPRPFSISGQLVYGDHSTAFNNASVTVDAISGRGDVLVETRGPKPLISGRLQLAALDLNPYLARVSGETAAAPAESTTPLAPPRASGLQPIDVGKVGYDSAPLDYAGLRSFNANFELITGVLQVQKLRIDNARMIVVLNEGFLAATLTRMEMYGGAGTGVVRIDARGTPLRFEESLDVENVRSLPLFTDAFGFGGLDATANVSIHVEAEGRNQKELISSLRGAGALYFAKGAFKGVDFGGFTRTVKNLLAGKVTGPDAQTPFDKFSSTLQIQRGIVAFRDFKLEGTRLQVLGQGSIDLPNQGLDLRFSPRTVFSRDKTTGAAKSTGVPLPFRAVGPWTALKFTTDITGAGKREQEREICAVTRDC
jgi:AsmA protein